MDGKYGSTHCHIRWSDKATLDWERFATKAEAEKSAKELALPGESFSVEEHGESCPQCMKLKKSSEPGDEAIA
jgi:hypothetical protein